MSLYRFALVISAWSASAVATHAQPATAPSSLLQLEYETSSENSDGGSSSSSNGRQALIETVIEETSDGDILLYDTPRDEEGKPESNFWYFPARIINRTDGTSELLDLEAVQSRIDAWLQDHTIPREACGLWSHGGGFPYKVDCDPNSILDQIEPFNLRIHDLAAGKEFSHPLGLGLGFLQPLPEPRSGYFVTVSIDQYKMRMEEIESQLILSQMLSKNITREQAKSDASDVQFSGLIRIEFDTNPEGKVTRRTEISEIVVTRPDDGQEAKRSRVTVERQDN